MGQGDRGRLPASRTRIARGARWDRFAKAVIDRYGGICHICGHGGARQLDHLIPETEQPGRAWKAEEFRPAHGAARVNNPCPVCSEQCGQPVYCNQLRGQGSVDRARRIIAKRIAEYSGKSPLDARMPGTPAGDRDAGREW